jgi:hypothetical protein
MKLPTIRAVHVVGQECRSPLLRPFPGPSSPQLLDREAAGDEERGALILHAEHRSLARFLIAL